ncbi:HAD family hydrolase [Streptomyces sp. SYP-A7185]|uniref:HAD family hydrolase n=1 Tax=Streptomyces sp. SYP-A7185 TaxID=3040076 RepID=UPI0038F64972
MTPLTNVTRGDLAAVLRGLRAVVFDTDGVITDSARMHALARRLPAVRGRHVPPRRHGGVPGLTQARTLRPDRAGSVAAEKERLYVTRLSEHGIDAHPGGDEAARLDPPGKPRPDHFLEAARRLGVPVGRAAVVEDALAGAEAGRRGGFALFTGVDRASTEGSRERLLRHGADLVVRDLEELLVGGTAK